MNTINGYEWPFHAISQFATLQSPEGTGQPKLLYSLPFQWLQLQICHKGLPVPRLYETGTAWWPGPIFTDVKSWMFQTGVGKYEKCPKFLKSPKYWGYNLPQILSSSDVKQIPGRSPNITSHPLKYLSKIMCDFLKSPVFIANTNASDCFGASGRCGCFGYAKRS